MNGNRISLLLFLLLFVPAAFAARMPDASSFSLMGVTGLFLFGAIRRKLGK